MSIDLTPPSGTRALSYKRYRYFWLAIILMTFGVQIMSVSVGWQIYDITRNPLFLGYVGLSLFLPSFLLVLVTGWTADRFPRRAIIAIAISVEVLCALVLLFFALNADQEIAHIYVVLVALGTARAFMGPAAGSLAPNLVPPEALANAVALNATAWQFANIAGPAVGGLLYGVGAHYAYGTAALLASLAVCSVMMIERPPQKKSNEATSIATVLAGFRYIWKQKVVLGAISLDLFAVLLGGAVALLPVYARDILQVGPEGLGMLRAAPGVGAIVVVLIVTRFPVRDHAGLILFGFVAAFGAFTAVFGLSTNVWLSIFALAMVGGCDMVSVIIRDTIMQLWTPDEVRGRVNAVNSVFIGASNELGEFRAGVVAAKWGTVFAVAGGGLATMAIAATWSVLFPGLRRQRGIDKAEV